MLQRIYLNPKIISSWKTYLRVYRIEILLEITFYIILLRASALFLPFERFIAERFKMRRNYRCSFNLNRK